MSKSTLTRRALVASTTAVPAAAALGLPVTADTFIVRDANGHALAYVYFEDEPAGDRRPG